MRLFTPKERDIIKSIIVDELKKIDGIISIMLVGSGSVGFTDEVSDLDLSIVIGNGSDMNTIMNSVKDFICNQWEILYAEEMQARGLQVYMLDNYLEIDIGYVTFENVSAIRERWLVVYDTTDEIDEIMKETWKVNKNNHGKKESVDVGESYSNAAENIWHFLMHAIVGVKRKNYWRAMGEMDIARNILIELLGYKYSLETKRFRNVDMFPNETKNILHKTIPTELNLTAFRNSICVLIDAIYDELEEFYNKDNKIKVTRKDVKEYYYDIIGKE